MPKRKSTSMIVPKSEHPFINKPIRMKAINYIPQTPKNDTTPISWSKLDEINLEYFLKQTDQQEQPMKEIVDQENAQKQERIKPLLVKYLNDNGYLNKKKYDILPYVM